MMNRFYANLGLLGASLMIHGGAFVSLDHSVAVWERKAEHARLELERRRKLEAMPFEFVEAPPQTRPGEPEKPAKVSDRDALNQDALEDKSRADGKTSAPVRGPADQLAQRRVEDPQPPVAASVPRLPQQAAPNAKEASLRDVASDDIMAIEKAAAPVPASTPQAPVPGLTGRDKITPPPVWPAGGGPIALQSQQTGGGVTTQEMAKSPSTGARLFGQTSFEATGSGMGAYMKNMKEKIWLAWFPYLAFVYPSDFRGADAVLSITLDKEGTVKIVRVVESAGTPLFASYCMEAIQRAGSFGPLPEEILVLLGKDEIEMRFGFHYR